MLDRPTCTKRQAKSFNIRSTRINKRERTIWRSWFRSKSTRPTARRNLPCVSGRRVSGLTGRAGTCCECGIVRFEVHIEGERGSQREKAGIAREYTYTIRDRFSPSLLPLFGHKLLKVFLRPHAPQQFEKIIRERVQGHAVPDEMCRAHEPFVIVFRLIRGLKKHIRKRGALRWRGE